MVFDQGAMILQMRASVDAQSGITSPWSKIICIPQGRGEKSPYIRNNDWIGFLCLPERNLLQEAAWD